jgi:hypothetical protein
VLLFMWWVWLLVTVFRTGWTVVSGLGRLVRWFLWL